MGWPTTSATARPRTSTRTATVRPTVPKAASRRRAAAPHALTHSHESLGSFTRNLSAMSLDDSATAETAGSGLAGHPRSATPDPGGAHALEHFRGRRRRAGVGAGALRAPRAAVGALAAGRREARRPPRRHRGRRRRPRRRRPGRRRRRRATARPTRRCAASAL